MSSIILSQKGFKHVYVYSEGKGGGRFFLLEKT